MYGIVLLLALGGAQETVCLGWKAYPTHRCPCDHYHGPLPPFNHSYLWPGYACWGGCGGYASPAYGVPMTPLINPIPPRVYTLADEERKLDEKIKEKERLDRKKAPKPEPEPDAEKPTKKPKPDDDASVKASAVITIFLPPGAKLSIDGRAVSAAGVKTFVTPELERGCNYFYEVTVEVDRDGKPAVEKRRLVLHAGDTVHADYRDLGGGMTAKR
jgi:uncharacterized protein (TIGR03000 family)